MQVVAVMQVINEAWDTNHSDLLLVVPPSDDNVIHSPPPPTTLIHPPINPPTYLINASSIEHV
jgi:hypothetical protein